MNPTEPGRSSAILPSAPTDLVLDRVATNSLIQHLRNLLLSIDAHESPDPDDVAVLALAVARHDATSAYARVLRKGVWTSGRPGKGHFVWHGLMSPSGVPVMRTWNGKNYVPVYRILWPLYRPDDCIGKPARNERVCIDQRCASPMCFEFAIPVVVLGRDVTGTWRAPQEGKPARRPVWHGRTTFDRGIEYPACEQCGAILPPNGLSMREYSDRWFGKQRRCGVCEMAARHELEREGLRRMPRSYDHSDIDPYVRAATIFNEDGTHGPAWRPEDGEYGDPQPAIAPLEDVIARTPAQHKINAMRAAAEAQRELSEVEAAQAFTRMLNEYDAQFVEDVPAEDVDNAT